MELQTLKYFSAVCREGSFLAASKKLGYAQPNLSARIAQLEKELGCTLLVRSKNGTIPTEKGELLLEYAERIIGLEEEVRTVLQVGGVKQHLKLGAMETAAITFVPTLLQAFHAACPAPQISVQTGTSEALARGVLSYELDGAFLAGGAVHEALNFVDVRTERLVLISTKALETAPLSELLLQPLIVFPAGCSYRRMLESLLAEHGIVADRRVEVTSVGALISGVSAGLGIGLVPQSAAEIFSAAGALAVHELPAPYQSAKVRFVFRKAAQEDEAMRRLITVIREQAAFNAESLH